MNKIMCFLTGGHRYSDVNIRTQTMPDDFNIVEISNHCIKCGEPSVFLMNVGKIIEQDMARIKGGKKNG